MSSRRSSWLLVLLLVCSWVFCSDRASGQYAPQAASTVYKRRDELFPQVRVRLHSEQLRLFTFETAQSLRWLALREGNLLAWPPFQVKPMIRDPFAYRVLSNGKFPVQVVEEHLIDLPAPAFLNALIYLRTLQSLAKKTGEVPCPYFQGVGSLAAASMYYPTNQAWSVAAKEEAALCYLFVALRPKATLPIAALRLENEGQASEAAKETIRSYVRDGLSELYAGRENRQQLIGKSAGKILEKSSSSESATTDTEKDEQETPDQHFQLLEVLAPGIPNAAHHNEPLDPALRTKAGAMVRSILENRKGFRHLPSVFRLLRHLETVAAGRFPTVLARTEAGMPVAENLDARSVERYLDGLRRICFGWFKEEVQLRGGGKLPMRSPQSVNWDPHSLIELMGLLITTSAEFGRLRVQLHENPNRSAEEVVKLVEDAFATDLQIRQLSEQHLAPIVEVVPCKAAPTGLALILRWEQELDGKTFILGKLFFEDAFSRGGSGIPSPPGIAFQQQVRVCIGGFTNLPRSGNVEQVEPGDFVESLGAVPPGRAAPKPSSRWHEVVDTRQFQSNKRIELFFEGHPSLRLCGTPSQEVWARRSVAAESPWDWIPMATLRPGNHVYHTHHSGVVIQRIGRAASKQGEHDRSGEMDQSDYVRFVIAGSNHTHVNGFVVRCETKRVVAESKHGLLVGATDLLLFDEAGRECMRDIGSVDASQENKQFRQIIGYNTDAAKVARRKDLLINNSDDQREVIYWIAYEIDGRRRALGMGHSHGFCVVGEEEPVAAHEIAVGDQLVRDEKDSSPARVTGVAIEEAPAGKKWSVRHPRLLSSEWLNATGVSPDDETDSGNAPGYGVLVHTDERRILAGLPKSTRVALALPPTGGDPGGQWRVGQQVPFGGVRTFQLDRVDDPDHKFHMLLTCNPEAERRLVGGHAFVPQLVSEFRRTISGDLLLFTTETGRHLRCGPGTMIWSPKGDVRQKALVLETVEARHFRVGRYVMVLPPDSPTPRLTPEKVTSICWLDAFSGLAGDDIGHELPANVKTELEKAKQQGYFGLLMGRLYKPRIFTIEWAEKDYNNIFAEGVLISLAYREYKLRDWWEGYHGAGDSPGASGSSGAGENVGRIVKGGKISDSPVLSPSLSGTPSDLKGRPAYQFTEADRKILRSSLDRLQRGMDEFLARGPRPQMSAGRQQRFQRFITICVRPDYRSLPKALGSPALAGAYMQYTEYRACLLKMGHPEALPALTRVGVVLAYLLYEADGPGHEILDDLLNVQLRLVLRPDSGETVWSNTQTLVRDTVRFALEYSMFDKEDTATAGISTARRTAKYWDASWTPNEWRSLLLDQIQAGQLHSDVLAEPAGDLGRQRVLLWNLLLQLDHRSDMSQVLQAFVSDDFMPGTEFGGEGFRNQFQLRSQ